MNSTPLADAPPTLIQVTFLSNSAKIVSTPAGGNLLRVSLRAQGGIPFKCGGGLFAVNASESNQ